MVVSAQHEASEAGLQILRAGLRERMRQSPLMDAAGFARGIEQAYRSMWQKWCDQRLQRPESR